MVMRASQRKFVLTVHITCSVGWIGSVVAYIALGVTAATNQKIETIRAAWTAMAIIGWYGIVPLALAALLTGLVMSLGTKWGLFQHYWTLLSFTLTTFATLILLLHMPDVTRQVVLVQSMQAQEAARLGGDLFHAGFGLLVLLVIQWLNVYKPRGLTRYGWRKQRERRSANT